MTVLVSKVNYMYIDPSEIEKYPTRSLMQTIINNILTTVGLVVAILVITGMILDLVGMGDVVTSVIIKVGEAL